MTEWQGEHYFASRYFNHREQVEYVLFWQRDLVECFTRKLTNPLPKSALYCHCLLLF
jgi:hypothetical protein